MKAVLLIDFGSTYTKVTAVDVEGEAILGTAQSFTTIETDIMDGLGNAVAILKDKIGDIEFAEQYACSSAAGGLRMVAIGLVPELTAKAARQASLGAGAKVIKTYSYELTAGDLREIDQINPDICLLTGGTDGGNKENILTNAATLAKSERSFPIIIAGNRVCADECAEILKDKQIHICENVMPKLLGYRSAFASINSIVKNNGSVIAGQMKCDFHALFQHIPFSFQLKFQFISFFLDI